MTDDSSHHSETLMFIARAIATRGLAVMNVGSGRCSVPGCVCEPEPVPWSYTIGLVERHHPELVTLGLAPVHATALLNWVHDEAVAGRPLQVGETARFDGVAVTPIPVPTPWVTSDDNPMGRWWAHYSVGRANVQPPIVWQLLWADGWDRFPGQSGCQREIDAAQPIIQDHPTWRPGSPHPGRRSRLRIVR